MSGLNDRQNSTSTNQLYLKTELKTSNNSQKKNELKDLLSLRICSVEHCQDSRQTLKPKSVVFSVHLSIVLHPCLSGRLPCN